MEPCLDNLPGLSVLLHQIMLLVSLQILVCTFEFNEIVKRGKAHILVLIETESTVYDRLDITDISEEYLQVRATKVCPDKLIRFHKLSYQH